jgi:transposase-like protein
MAERIGQETERALIEAYRTSDHGGRTLATQLGVGATTVYRVLARNGVPIEDRKRHGRSVRRYLLTDDQQRLVCAAVRAGESSHAIARRFAVSRETIFATCRRHGVTPRIGRPVGEVAPDVLVDVIAKYADGWSQQRIAKHVGANQTTVSRWLRSAGVSLNAPRSHAAHASFKGGVVRWAGGYVAELLPMDHRFRVMANMTGYALQHRLVMASHLGRPLLASETVHHINGKRDDNRIENLELRIGKHGKGVALCCADCGSRNIIPTELAKHAD